MDAMHRNGTPSPFLRLGAALLALALGLAAGCSKSPEEIKAAKVAEIAQTTGKLVVKSNRAGTTVEAVRAAAAGEPAPVPVKGNEEGGTEHAFSGLPPGKYTVTARSAGWADLTQETTIEAGKTAEAAFHFKSGSLKLDSLPAGATVKLGNTILGKTPLTVPQLPLGEIALTLEYPLWPALPFKVTIAENTEAAETARLPHGKLVVESFPAGATVLFGKRPIGQTPLTIERYQAGNTKLTVQAKDFPPVELAVAMEDRGEVKLAPVLAMGFPELDPAALLRAVWVDAPPEDKERLSPGFRDLTGYRSRNGIVKNLNRKKLYDLWLAKKYRFTGVVKVYKPETGVIEFAEVKTELARYRVFAQLSVNARADSALVSLLTSKAKGGVTVALYGTLGAVEEPEWPAKHIAVEFTGVEPMPNQPAQPPPPAAAP